MKTDDEKKEEIADLVSKDSDTLRKQSQELDDLADVVDDLEDTIDNVSESAPQIANIIGNIVNKYYEDLPLNEHINIVRKKIMEEVSNISLMENSEFESFKNKVVDPLIKKIEKQTGKKFADISENYREALKAAKSGDDINAMVYLEKAFLDARQFQMVKENKNNINPKMSKGKLIKLISEMKK